MAITHPFSAALMTLDWLSQPSVALVSAVTLDECANIRFLGIIYKKRYHGPWICYIFAYLHICIRRQQLFPGTAWSPRCMKLSTTTSNNNMIDVIRYVIKGTNSSVLDLFDSRIILLLIWSHIWFVWTWVDNSNIIPMHGTTLKKLHYLACY